VLLSNVVPTPLHPRPSSRAAAARFVVLPLQMLHPHRVVEVFGLQPCERIPLGRTGKTEPELRAFLRSISHRYTMEVRRNPTASHNTALLCRPICGR